MEHTLPFQAHLLPFGNYLSELRRIFAVRALLWWGVNIRRRLRLVPAVPNQSRKRRGRRQRVRLFELCFGCVFVLE